MIHFFGHIHQYDHLIKHLPVVSLFVGPQRVGKRTLAEHLIQQYKFEDVDVLRVSRLDVAGARKIINFGLRTPMGWGKMVLIDLDGSTGRKAINMLLKTLEEPPEKMMFILTASVPVPATVISRSWAFPFGYLSHTDLFQVYSHQGLSDVDADRLAELSQGQVTTMDQADPKPYKTAVGSLLTALRNADEEMLETTLKAWTPDKHRFFERWVTDCAVGRKVMYADLVIGPKLATDLLMAMHDGNRPALMLEFALKPIFAKIKDGAYA